MPAKDFIVNIYKKYKPFFKGAVLAALAVILIASGLYYFEKTKITGKPGESVLEEAGKMSESKNDFWWLNSGGLVYLEGNNISTVQGKLPEGSKWQKLYAKTNSRDTDGGYYPQNIFRLVTRKKWQNFSETLYFKIDKNNLSESQYRNESNGVLLFNRYQDGDNLYYTGLRVDGQAVIKKKIEGKYYTLAEKEVFTNNKKYDRNNNPNLIPQGKWLGIKSEVKNSDNGAVDIKFYVDKEQNGNWQLVLETEDKNDEYGKAPILEEGYVGIRTDFMDVTFKDYIVKEN